MLDHSDPFRMQVAQGLFHAQPEFPRVKRIAVYEIGHRYLDDMVQVMPFRMVLEDFSDGPSGTVLVT